MQQISCKALVLGYGEGRNEVRLDTGCDVFLVEVSCHEMCGVVGSCFVKALEHED